MKNNKIEYLTIGQSLENNAIKETTYIADLEKKLRNAIAVILLSIILLLILGVTLAIKLIDPYTPASGAYHGLDRQEILELQNEREASKMIDAQVSRGGHEIRTMEATAYTWTGDKTFTGVWPEVGMVAVDPSVIALGTQLYVEGYGPAIAADTGGDIVGNRIDLYMDTDAECWEFGRREVKVKIIEEDL